MITTLQLLTELALALAIGSLVFFTGLIILDGHPCTNSYRKHFTLKADLRKGAGRPHWRRKTKWTRRPQYIIELHIGSYAGTIWTLANHFYSGRTAFIAINCKRRGPTNPCYQPYRLIQIGVTTYANRCPMLNYT